MLSNKDLSNFTALDYAIIENNIEMVKLLVDNGAIITDDSYMLSIGKNLKEITGYFDSLDDDKKIFLKKKS